MPEEIWRTFIAIELDRSLRSALAKIQEQFRRQMPPGSVRWVAPEGIHLTLMFLGDTPRTRLTQIEAALQRACAGLEEFEFSVEGRGCFPNTRRPRVVWVAVRDKGQSLMRLSAAVEQEVAPLGWPTEERAFSPHLTLGRVGRGVSGRDEEAVGKAVEASVVEQIGRQSVTGVGLIRSELHPDGTCLQPIVERLLVADTDLSEGESAARAAGASSVETLQCDLGTDEGIRSVLTKIGDRPVDALIANAGHGLGHAFLDQEWDKLRHVIDTNVVGTVHLIHAVGRRMRDRNAGRILVTGSIAGHIPGAFQLVYNSSKAFIDDFCVGLANELKETDVVITLLEPGVTDTEFFERAGMLDTKAGQSNSKADPAKVAQDGYSALLKGDHQITSGFMNKVQTVFADILPDAIVAQMHRALAEPKGGSTPR